jgi:probable HAF family extracellular repeat protein
MRSAGRPAPAWWPPAIVPGGRTEAHAVNAGGDIVGAAQAADGQDHAVLWPAGTPALVGT